MSDIPEDVTPQQVSTPLHTRPPIIAALPALFIALIFLSLIASLLLINIWR